MDHIDLHWEEQGTGEPLVLLHGNGEDCSIFGAQMAHFSKKYRVLAVDTRGHGKSPRGSAPFTFATFARDLLEFLDRQGLERVHLLGFSDGGNTALTFALAHQDRLKSLILNGADLFPAGVKRRVQVPIILSYRLVSLLARLDPGALPKRELLALMVEQPDIDPAALGALRVPTLVIAGTRDMIAEAHTRLIHRSIPGSRLALVEGDHFIAVKKSRLFNRAVEDFLDRLAREEREG